MMPGNKSCGHHPVARSHIRRFMWLTRGPPGACPMLAPQTLLSGSLPSSRCNSVECRVPYMKCSLWRSDLLGLDNDIDTFIHG